MGFSGSFQAESTPDHERLGCLGVSACRAVKQEITFEFYAEATLPHSQLIIDQEGIDVRILHHVHQADDARFS